MVNDRGSWILERVRGRSVVHLGFADVGCELTRSRDGAWLHARLLNTTSRLVGLDVVEESVEKARRQGFDVRTVDCTNPADVLALRLPRFDVVLLGEVIEHVDNPGGLLEAAGALASGNGLLIVTTPNARRLMDVLLALGGREVVHPDHVAVYSTRTLTSLLEGHGWNVVETLAYMNPRPSRRPQTAKEVLLALGHEFQRVLATRLSPYVADGLILVARRSLGFRP